MAKIMIVDDDQALLHMMAELLSIGGDVCSVFWDPRQAQEALRGPEEDLPQAIVLDVMMPGVDGFSFLTALQERDETRSIPVIVVTAKHGVVDVFRGQPNIFAFLEKPFMESSLRDAVARAVARKT